MIFEDRPAVVGHRGFGAGEPGGYRENSLSSFRAAAAAGVPWVELDARRTADDELAVWHDPLTPAGRPVLACTAAELAAVGIVGLADALAVLPAAVGVDIDVKTVAADSAQPRTHELMAAFLRIFTGTRPLLVSSFDPTLPSYLAGQRAVTGRVPLGLITSEDVPAADAIPAAAGLRLDAVCLPVRALEAQPEHVIETAHRAGLEVLAWSPGPGQAARLAAAGIDAVCVDDVPGALMAVG